MARHEVEIASNQFEDLSQQMQLELMQTGNNYDESILEVTLTQKAQALWQKAQSDLIEVKSKQCVTYSKYLKATGKLQAGQ